MSSESIPATATATATQTPIVPAADKKDGDKDVSEKKSKGARGAPKKRKEPSHDVKSAGGSTKNARRASERNAQQKTISKPAITKLFCPKIKQKPAKDGDKPTYTPLDSDHEGMRISNTAIKPIQKFVTAELQVMTASMIAGLAKSSRHIITIEDTYSTMNQPRILPYASAWLRA